MSGIYLSSEMRKLDSIIEKIKASQDKVLKAFEEHNTFVTKSLERIQQLKTESKVEVVKVKDPLEEIKKINEIYKDRELNGYLRVLIMGKISECLTQYGNTKISASFKEIFLNLFNECLQFTNDSDHLFFNGKSFKESFLKVRDIRWLLTEMEKYPQIFAFSESDLELMKENGASRDNIYLVKKFLKKDGEYEEFYPEDEGGGLKLKYHMNDGVLNGQITEYYQNGKVKNESSYTKGIQDNVYKVWYESGQQFVEGKINGENIQWYENGIIMNKYFRKDGKLEGEYKEWYENGNLWIKTSHKDNKVYGNYELYFPSGTLHQSMFCLDGLIKKDHSFFKIDGEFKQFWENGNLWVNCHYKNGILHGEYKEWDSQQNMVKDINYIEGIIELKDEHFYLDENKLKLKLKSKFSLFMVLFYSGNCEFVPEYKKLLEESFNIQYGMCYIEKNKKVLNKVSKSPAIYIYICELPWIRFDGEMTKTNVDNFIRDALKIAK